MTDFSTAPIALLMASVANTSGVPGWGTVRVAASERMRLLLMRADCCSVLQVRYLGFPIRLCTVGPCDQLPAMTWRQ